MGKLLATISPSINTILQENAWNIHLLDKKRKIITANDAFIIIINLQISHRL